MQLGRIAQIAKVFAEEGLGALTGRAVPLQQAAGAETVTAIGQDEHRSDRETAARLRRAFERLGPTFVKFGQLLATRIDLFSDEFCAELGKLHSAVSPYPFADARRIVEEDLGHALSEVFAEFPEVPVAAASIAQVYRARLRRDGQVVAVKVQRPDLESNLLRDLELIVQISGWIDKLVPVYRRSMLHFVAQEYASRARQEINFLSEADAISRFQDLLAEDPMFDVPKVYRDLCASRVVVMEWIEGTKLDQVRTGEEMTALGLDPGAFSRELLRLQVCMSYEHGFIHCDTHPGNIIVKSGGRVALIDFGLHAHIPKATRQVMVELLFYQSQCRFVETVDAMTELSPPADKDDLPAYKRELLQMLESAPRDKGIVANKISDQLVGGMRIGAKYKNKALSELLMVIRNLTIVEGIILRFSPEMNAEEEVGGIVQGIIRRRLSPKSMTAELGPLMMQLGMTLSRRSESVERLLKMERNFASSSSLGDFLRREKVLRDAPEAAPPSRFWTMVMPLVYVLAGAALAALLRR